MDYDAKTVIELKMLCKERGLRISGTKNEVVLRLMEDDESKTTPAQQIVSNPQVDLMHQQMAEMKTIMIQNEANKSNPIAIMVGGFLILYVIFRIFITIQFLPFMNDGGGGLTVLTAMVICLALIYSAVLILRNYRIGCYIALGILTVSGGLSILLHDADFNPLSLGFGGWVPVSWSIFCSGSCMVIALLPLLDNTMKNEWPPEFASFENKSDSQTNLKCASCAVELRIPRGFKGRIQCPSCNTEMDV
jgi:hypothetical protein